ncbi:hypothetical protein B0H14DRAFT_3520545 [Mycena olivaceomarginata]|nr:hypothetical protein B0H14DRAFT_3520545 [Mycena olivaceomarginata]
MATEKNERLVSAISSLCRVLHTVLEATPKELWMSRSLETVLRNAFSSGQAERGQGEIHHQDDPEVEDDFDTVLDPDPDRSNSLKRSGAGPTYRLFLRAILSGQTSPSLYNITNSPRSTITPFPVNSLVQRWVQASPPSFPTPTIGARSTPTSPHGYVDYDDEEFLISHSRAWALPGYPFATSSPPRPPITPSSSSGRASGAPAILSFHHTWFIDAIVGVGW